MKRSNDFTYRELFFSLFKISAGTFGGGYVIVPLMRKKFVEQLHWIDDKEMLELTAIAQSSPGVMAVNASLLVGYRMAGLAGALLAILGTVVPPLTITSILMLFYQAFRTSPIVNMAMAGMLCAVAAVVLDVGINMAHSVVRQGNLIPVLILLAAFVAVFFWEVNIIFIILACGLVGAADSYIRIRGRRGKERKT